MKRQGLFQLPTPQDLLAKARHDLQRLRTNPMDAYAAFDFFVAVRHIPDWLFPHDKQQRDALFSRHVELRVSRHIADGAKHFEVTHPQHIQVAGTSAPPPTFQGDSFQTDAFQVGGLIIDLDPRDPDTAALGGRIHALPLAERVFAVIEKVVP